MIYKNQQIYDYWMAVQSFNGFDIQMPARVSFYLCRNLHEIQKAAEEFEMARERIGAQYGVPAEGGNGYIIPPDSLPQVNIKLQELFNLEKELNIHIFKLSDFDGLMMTCQQMASIMFMVEED